MAHVDRDALGLSAARLPDLRSREACRGNAGLRGSGHAKRRRQLRLLSAQRDGIERGGVAAGGDPEIGQDFAGRLHGRHFPYVQECLKMLSSCRIILLFLCLPWKELQWLPSIH